MTDRIRIVEPGPMPNRCSSSLIDPRRKLAKMAVHSRADMTDED